LRINDGILMVDTKRSKRPVICLIVCHREFCEKES